MNQESVDMLTRDGFSKLLHSPGCSRMGRDIAVKNAATSHFHHHEHVQHSEGSRDGYQEVRLGRPRIPENLRQLMVCMVRSSPLVGFSCTNRDFRRQNILNP
jgi:hypothetical protein